MKRAIYIAMLVVHVGLAGFGFLMIYECVHFYNKASSLKERTIAELDSEQRFVRSLNVADARGIAATHAAAATASFVLSSLIFSWSRGLRPSNHRK